MKVLPRLIALLVLTGVYLYAFPAATLFYGAIVLLHAGAGVVTAVLLARFLFRRFRNLTIFSRLGWLLLAAGTVAGLALIYTGTARLYTPILWTHIGLSIAGTGLLVAGWNGSPRLARLSPALRLVAVLVAVALIAVAARYGREAVWKQRYRVSNPALPPSSMDGEGDGPEGMFFPSSAQTADGKKIPAEFFMKSDACQRCHADIYDQWFSSAHHFSSFNNQWYRASIEYMQDVVGTRPSKWCGGCHDPAVLFSGLMDTPIKEIVDRPESHAGLGCMMCHSIVQVKSSMGQGDFIVEYPELHELAASESPLMRRVHDVMVRLNPEPHRRTFLKPFMRQQTAEFCSTCHKVHLDVPVNHYRWVRGFNDYDNWQASGVSGQGARSFYYPPKPQKCVDCHMPLVASHDDANIDGKVHSHRFPGANTALPVANEDAAQLDTVTKFLKDNIVSVDIFAVSPAQPKSEGGEQRLEMSTSFAVGEEAEVSAPVGVDVAMAPISAPIDRVQPAVRRGDTVRVDVVVRTRKVGHFFPGGTVDAFDVWVELEATDSKGKRVFWSGMVEDNGRGPVEKGAHFYRSLMVDAHGNPINKRNAWANRALVYVRLIPPGAADTARFRIRIPENVGDEIKLKARLNYRKFMWWNTQFAYAGVYDRGPRSLVTADYDDRPITFDGDTSKVSGKLKYVPNLPSILLAEDEATLRVVPKSEKAPEAKVVAVAEDWERWNDYGIGMLLQGDLKAAEAAFQRVTEAAPNRADGWVNQGRVAVQEGDTETARQVLERALAVNPNLASAHFFYARALKSDGEYDRAMEHLRKALAQYPRDRVVRNELGRVLFLKRQYADAIKEFEYTLSIDPEDLQAHYNLMLCYNGLGDEARAQEHQKRYLRFKADEAAQALTGKYRQSHPEDNNERQAIHEHESVPLPVRSVTTATAARNEPPSKRRSSNQKPVGSTD